MTEGSALKQNAGAHTRDGAADLVSGLVSAVVPRIATPLLREAGDETLNEW